MAAAFTLVLLVDEGVTPELRARLDAALVTQGARVLDGEATRALVSALQVEQCADVECLARLSVLAEADRAAFVRAEDDALDVLIASGEPRSARALLRASEDDAVWSSAIAAALFPPAVAARVIETPPEPHVENARVAAAPAPVVAPTRAPDDAGDLAAARAVGAVLVGVGALSLVGGGVAGVLALVAVRASSDAKFQDDAVAYGRDANARLWITGLLAGVTVATGVTGGILLAVGLSE